MADDRPIIRIKKIKKVTGGHHGGAWKVAYADFVTAMMAFFLLLWLLAAASDEQLKAISEYFTPTIGLKDSEGIGFRGGESANIEEGEAKNDTSPVNLIAGAPPEGQTTNNNMDSIVDGDEETQMFEDAKKEIAQAFESDPNLREFAENILMTQTPEGLKLELRDSDKNSMFLPGSDELSRAGQEILRALIPVIRRLPNHLSLSGHTDAIPFSGRDPNYSNWDLSADRALSARRFLQNNAVTEQRVKKIVGYASEELSLPDDPTSPINRRIEVILLRGSHASLLPQSKAAPRSLLTVPNANDTLKLRQQKIDEIPGISGADLAEPIDLNTQREDVVPTYNNPFMVE